MARYRFGIPKFGRRYTHYGQTAIGDTISSYFNIDTLEGARDIVVNLGLSKAQLRREIRYLLTQLKPYWRNKMGAAPARWCTMHELHRYAGDLLYLLIEQLGVEAATREMERPKPSQYYTKAMTEEE
jgi:hypothetical protein